MSLLLHHWTKRNAEPKCRRQNNVYHAHWILWRLFLFEISNGRISNQMQVVATPAPSKSSPGMNNIVGALVGGRGTTKCLS